MEQKAKIAVKKFKKFTSEFRKHMTTAITAAFAFLMAFVWRDAIQESINAFVTKLNIQIHNIYIYKILTAVIITLLCVIALIIVSKWGSRENS